MDSDPTADLTDDDVRRVLARMGVIQPAQSEFARIVSDGFARWQAARESVFQAVARLRAERAERGSK